VRGTKHDEDEDDVKITQKLEELIYTKTLYVCNTPVHVLVCVCVFCSGLQAHSTPCHFDNDTLYAQPGTQIL